MGHIKIVGRLLPYEKKVVGTLWDEELPLPTRLPRSLLTAWLNIQFNITLLCQNFILSKVLKND
jgi:hypothetical protein